MAWGILFLQILAYISIIPMVMYANWYHYFIAYFIYFLIGGLGMIVGYHRLHSHRSFKVPIWFEKLITYFATMSLTLSLIHI